MRITSRLDLAKKRQVTLLVLFVSWTVQACDSKSSEDGVRGSGPTQRQVRLTLVTRQASGPISVLLYKRIGEANFRRALPAFPLEDEVEDTFAP